MGFLGKLFEKKTCDICGGEIGLLGNRKLEDGNCCKNCAAKLSPWFSGRKHSTVEEIKGQIDYREANKGAVAAFQVSKTLGRDTKVLIDSDNGQFIVTSERNWRDSNPDVIKLNQVTGCDLEIDEDQEEVEKEVKDEDGGTSHESYNPRRYKYFYDFDLTIYLNHPYFDEIKFRLNDDSVEVKAKGGKLLGFLPIPGSPELPTLQDKENDPVYSQYAAMGQEIKEALMSLKNPPSIDPSEESSQAEPLKAETEEGKCPWCGSAVSGGNFCEHCGGNLKG